MSIEFGDASYGIGRGLNIDTFTNQEDIVMHTLGTGSIGFLTNQIEQMRIDASGVVTISNELIVENQICFKAYGPSTRTDHNTTGETLQYSIISENIGGYYDSSTYTFTAPIEGTYLLYFSYYSNSKNDCRVDFVDKGGNTLIRLAREFSVNKNIGDPIVFHTSIIYKLSKNDTIRVNGSYPPFKIEADSVFGGYLLG